MTRIFVFSLILFSSFAHADKLPFDYDPNIAREAAMRPRQASEMFRNPKPYMWLYEMILPEMARAERAAEAFKSFQVHLQDSYSAFPNPLAIVDAALRNTGLYRGSITYVGFWPMNYRYTVLQGENNKRIIQVKVNFKNPRGSDLQDFTAKVKEAEAIWNASRPPHDFVYKFYFEVVTDAKQANYSVNIMDSTRGPYNMNWGRNWSARTIAHELGHMMGLGDEYETLSGKIDCLPESLMCDSDNGQLMPHHYYFILRRLI